MPIVPASEGARNISVRGSQEYLQTREKQTNQQSKEQGSAEEPSSHQVFRRNHRVSTPARDAARDSNYQTYSHSNPPRIYHKDLQEPDSTDTKAGSNIEEIQPFYSTDRASRGLVCSICEAYFFIQARREATTTKPLIFSREDPSNRYRDYIDPTSK